MSCKGVYHKRRIFVAPERVPPPQFAAIIIHKLREAGLPRQLVLLVLGILFYSMDADGQLLDDRFNIGGFCLRCECGLRYGGIALYY